MRRISLAVVGVDFDNKSGPSRRSEIKKCVPGEPIDLVPEPDNPADRNAIAVYSARGIQIGYIKAERAALIGGAMRRGIVEAIYQQSEEWGAVIRVHTDGTAPILPAAVSLQPDQQQAEVDPDWYPDEVWPD